MVATSAAFLPRAGLLEGRELAGAFLAEAGLATGVLVAGEVAAARADGAGDALLRGGIIVVNGTVSLSRSRHCGRHCVLREESGRLSVSPRAHDI